MAPSAWVQANREGMICSASHLLNVLNSISNVRGNHTALSSNSNNDLLAVVMHISDRSQACRGKLNDQSPIYA